MGCASRSTLPVRRLGARSRHERDRNRGRAWNDPDVVELIGSTRINSNASSIPLGDQDRGGRVAQRPLDPAKPHGTYPLVVYEMQGTTPDEVITSTMSEPTPPVKVTDDSWTRTDLPIGRASFGVLWSRWLAEARVGQCVGSERRRQRVFAMWCSRCGAEYGPGIERCAECDVQLVAEKPWTVEDLDLSLSGEPVLARSYSQSAIEVFQAALSALGASGWHVHTVAGPQLGATAHRERVSELDAAALVVTDGSGDGCVLTCRMRSLDDSVRLSRSRSTRA